jgi:hypothetical protein
MFLDGTGINLPRTEWWQCTLTWLRVLQVHPSESFNMAIVQKYACSNRSKLQKLFKSLPQCCGCLRGRASGASCRFLGELSIPFFIATKYLTYNQAAVRSMRTRKKFLFIGRLKNRSDVPKFLTDPLPSMTSSWKRYANEDQYIFSEIDYFCTT